MAAYQYTPLQDNDPSTEDGALGFADANGPNGEGASIFKEVVRTQETPPIITEVSNEALTVAHEVVHLLGPDHGDFGLMGDAPTRIPLSTTLTPTSIDKIRWLSHP